MQNHLHGIIFIGEPHSDIETKVTMSDNGGVTLAVTQQENMKTQKYNVGVTLAVTQNENVRAWASPASTVRL